MSKYRTWAETQGYLDETHPLPDDAALAAAWGERPQRSHTESSVEPYRGVVQNWVEQGVEMMAIWQHLQDDYQYRGSYSSVRRFVHKIRPAVPEV
ncbi:MAG: IS21 family transposase, partial [Chloroflexota bacterium]|nr:IS21 family transposase [Chloroflexota bacterium]